MSIRNTPESCVYVPQENITKHSGTSWENKKERRGMCVMSILRQLEKIDFFFIYLFKEYTYRDFGLSLFRKAFWRESHSKSLHNNKERAQQQQWCRRLLGRMREGASPPINGAALEHFFFTRSTINFSLYIPFAKVIRWATFIHIIRQ